MVVVLLKFKVLMGFYWIWWFVGEFDFCKVGFGAENITNVLLVCRAKL